MIRGYVIFGIIGTLSFYIAKLKTEQNYRFVQKFLNLSRSERQSNNIVHQSFNQLHFDQFRRENAQLLTYLRDANRSLMTGFFIFILLNIPTSAILWMMIIFNRLHGANVILFIMLASGQNIICFIFHLYICRLSAKIHKPTKLLSSIQIYLMMMMKIKMAKIMVEKSSVISKSCSMIVRNTNTNNIHKLRSSEAEVKKYSTNNNQNNYRLLLKLMYFIDQFHTTNQYTVTYGKYGKITYESIRLFAVSYWKFLVFSYIFWKKN